MHRLTRLALAAALVAAAPLAASARSTYLSAFDTKYGTTSTVLDTCSLCHPSGTSTFNSYGSELRTSLTAGSTITQALTTADPKDSDGDGYANGVEAKALTFPGDAKSYPAPTTAPAIAVSPGSVAFGTVNVGASSTQTVTVSNPGTATLTVSNVSRCTGTSTEFTATPTAFTVAAGGRATLTVAYAPTAAGTDSGCVAIANNSASPTVQVAVSGTGQAVVVTAPHVTVAPASLPFGTVTVGSSATQTTVVSNTGDADLVVSSVARCTGTSAEFSASPAAFTVAPGATQTVTVAYAPVDATTDTGCVAVASNDAATGTVNVSVTGTGAAAPSAVLDVDISRFTVGKRVDLSRIGSAYPKTVVLNAGAVAGTATLQLEGTVPDALGAPVAVYSASQDVTLAPGTSSKVVFPAYAAPTPETVTWTLTVVDADPDVDVATSTTKFVP